MGFKKSVTLISKWGFYPTVLEYIKITDYHGKTTTPP
jgi:hypothetical protein